MVIFIAGSWDEWEWIQANKIERRDRATCDGCGCVLSHCNCPYITDKDGNFKRIPLKSTRIVMGKNGLPKRVFGKIEV